MVAAGRPDFSASPHGPARNVALQHDQVVLDRDAARIDVELSQESGHGQGFGELMRLAIQRNLQFTSSF